jgi:hypothetical protein
MMKSFRGCFLLVVWVVCLIFSPEASGAFVGNKDSMRNLDAVGVEIDLDTVLEKDGLNKNQIRADVTAELKNTGIRILSESEWRAITGRPLFLIQVTGQKIQENWKFYTYAIHIRLIQDVQLLRDPQAEPFSASTWFHQIAGHGYIDDIRIRILEATQVFTEAFRSANPR